MKHVNKISIVSSDKKFSIVHNRDKGTLTFREEPKDGSDYSFNKATMTLAQLRDLMPALEDAANSNELMLEFFNEQEEDNV